MEFFFFLALKGQDIVEQHFLTIQNIIDLPKILFVFLRLSLQTFISKINFTVLIQYS